MFNKIFNRGKGKATGIDYLLSLTDASKNLRSIPPALVRGNPTLTKKIINDLSYAQRYTSGVLSWEEPPGSITEKTLNIIMDSFENMVSAGFESDRLNWLWVKHQDKNRIELHYVIPNVDLESGKRFSPYFDRVDRSRFRAWERYVNAVHGFSDPSDPAKKRDLRLPLMLPREKSQAINEIHSVISNMVSQGVVDGRNAIISHLLTAGYKVNRIAVESISIEDLTGRKLRLKGAFYAANFTPAKAHKDNKILAPETKAQRSERISELAVTLNKEIDVRARYITNRFKTSKVLHKNFELSRALDPGEIHHDRSTEFINSVSENTGGGCNRARAATDQSIQRARATLAGIELTSTKITEKLGNIEHAFAKFILACDDAFQRLRRKINQSRPFNQLKPNYQSIA